MRAGEIGRGDAEGIDGLAAVVETRGVEALHLRLAEQRIAAQRGVDGDVHRIAAIEFQPANRACEFAVFRIDRHGRFVVGRLGQRAGRTRQRSQNVLGVKAHRFQSATEHEDLVVDARDFGEVAREFVQRARAGFHVGRAVVNVPAFVIEPREPRLRIARAVEREEVAADDERVVFIRGKPGARTGRAV